MKKVAFLEYIFIFGEDTFDSLSQFERLLSQVFRAKDCEADIINEIVGSVGRRLILVKKNKDLLTKPTQADKIRSLGGKKIQL